MEEEEEEEEQRRRVFITPSKWPFQRPKIPLPLLRIFKVKFLSPKFVVAFAFVLMLGQMIFSIHVHIDTPSRTLLSHSLS